jgi:YrbI family 3-deoxy-D-manno-octulosonate 8-phosphate phosphatase
MKTKIKRGDLTKIKLVVFDFDGVFTDNTVIISEDGKESVSCSRSDGLGLTHLRNIRDILVLSAETNSVVKGRCKKLNIACIQACEDKLKTLKRVIAQRKLNSAQVAYAGNDINDLKCLQYVGLPIAVANARPELKPYARYITKNKGGHGAVREICDLFLMCNQGKRS